MAGAAKRSRLPASSYDVLLLVFIAALIWAALLRGVLGLVADHASNVGAVGLLSMLLVRPRRFGAPGATRRVVVTCSVVALVGAAIELAVGDSGSAVRFLNTRDSWDALAGVAAAVFVVLVHLHLAKAPS